ncbi:PAS domain-containing protein [Parvibaculum sp.]|uniref:PAS domain-containing protein n=1 Tax=Parvibaculum sp. TaxID=2024848 RepID=UPI003C75B4FC
MPASSLQKDVLPTQTRSARSERSLAFEAAWLKLPRSGLIPDKADFRPERLAPFLNDIYLLELSDNPSARLHVRLAGATLRERLGVDLRGQNYADFVPSEHREQSGLSMRLMFGPVPCGRWVRKEIVHTDGYREPIELTQFPMTDHSTGMRLVLGIATGFGDSFAHEPEGEFTIENRDTEEFIDIGAGVPR